MRKWALSKWLVALLAFGYPAAIGVCGYYGGGTQNHGHTTAAGDGGPLSNPAISGTATITGIRVSTLIVTGQAVFSSTIPVSFTSITVQSLNATGRLSVSSLTVTSTATLSFTTFNATTTFLQPLSLKQPTDESFPSLYFGDQVDHGFYFKNNAPNTKYIGVTLGAVKAFEFGDGFSNIHNYSNHLYPFANVTYDLGTSGTLWRVLYSSAIAGVTDGSNAGPGNVGQYMSSSTAAGMTASFPATGVFGDLVSIPLTAGDWDVTFCAGMNGGTTNTDVSFGISATSGNSSAGLIVGQNWYDTVSPSVSGVTNAVYCIPSFRVSLSGSATYYGKYKADYAGTIPKAGGTISARRAR